LGGWRKRKKCRKGEKGRIQDERAGGNRKEGTNDERGGGREREIGGSPSPPPPPPLHSSLLSILLSPPFFFSLVLNSKNERLRSVVRPSTLALSILFISEPVSLR
jgi:hypothetical protein